MYEIKLLRCEKNVRPALMRKAVVFNFSSLIAHMPDVLHTYHNSHEYTEVLMKFLKVDGTHKEFSQYCIHSTLVSEQ